MAHPFRRPGVAASTFRVVVLALSACGEVAAPPPEIAAGDRSTAVVAVCTGTGAHDRHGTFVCATCHLVGGSICFDPGGPAQAPGETPPAFDPVAKTCSSVACHGMYSGLFTYQRWDYGCDCPEVVTVPYEGGGGGTPSWYATGAGCSACHGNPPPAYPAWHGLHANRSFSGSNDCQLCHPDALAETDTGVGYALDTATTCTVNGGPNQSCALLHANGTVDVTPRWASRCISCH
jgi:hypothetical protein